VFNMTKNMCPKNTISAIKLQVSRTIIAMFMAIKAMFMAIKAMFMAIKAMCFEKLFVLIVNNFIGTLLTQKKKKTLQFK